VNVAVWESARHFQAALTSDGFQALARRMPFTSFPSLYRVASE
jgi:hypothetical protein